MALTPLPSSIGWDRTHNLPIVSQSALPLDHSFAIYSKSNFVCSTSKPSTWLMKSIFWTEYCQNSNIARCSSRKVPMNEKAEILHKVHESSDLLCSLFAFGSRTVWKQFDLNTKAKQKRCRVEIHKTSKSKFIKFL